MRTLSAYNFLTVNGFFRGPQDDISWHEHGGEEAEHSASSLQGDGILVFGRRTYELMASFWPTPMAAQQFPDVAAGMNRAEKIVFSRNSFAQHWQNAHVITGDIVGQMRSWKQQPGKNLTILGSGTIISLFADHGLIDEYQFMIDPVAIPEGTPVFSGIATKLRLQLIESRVFRSGAVLLSYRPVPKS